MGTITTTTINNSVAAVLQDDGTRWPPSELLGFLNDGQRETVLVKPTAYVKVVSLETVAGTKQELPADGVALVDVVRNMGGDGNTPGRAVRAISRQLLDNIDPAWHTAKASAVVKHFIHNPLAPKVWYAYPPQPASDRGRVEVAYSAVPPDATLGGAITLDDIYAPALREYMLHRAYAKDAEYAGNAEASARHYAQFLAMLGAKEVGEKTTAPAQALEPRSGGLPGSDK